MIQVIRSRTQHASHVYSIHLGWCLLNSCCKTCTARVQVSTWCIHPPKIAFVAKNRKLLNTRIMHLMGRTHITWWPADMIPRHGNIQAGDVYIFGKMMQKLAGLVFGTRASKPKTTQGAFQVMAGGGGGGCYMKDLLIPAPLKTYLNLQSALRHSPAIKYLQTRLPP